MVHIKQNCITAVNNLLNVYIISTYSISFENLIANVLVLALGVC